VAFGIVWPILYALMAVALVRIWQTPKSEERSTALKLFAAQLGFNYLWSFIFFGAEQLLASWVWISITLILVALTVRAFAKLDGLAAKLLWPYLAWMCFAFYLNSGVMLLNI
jgi:tryptophan-rich sensory protein